MLEPTGEKMIPQHHQENFIYGEHLARYFFATQFTKDKIVLDIACGTGYGTQTLEQEGASKVVGIDIDKETIDYAHQYFPLKNGEYIAADAQSIPFKENEFDVVVSFETLEHIPDYQLFLKEARRVLKPNGILILSTPNNEVYPKGNPFHIKEFNKTELRRELLNYFSTVDLRYQDNFLSNSIYKERNDLGEKTFTQRDISGSQLYLIAICSNSITQEVSNFNYITNPQELRDPTLEHELMERTKWAKSLEKDLEEKIKWTGAQERELIEGAKLGEMREKELEERTKWAQGLERQLQEKNEWIQKLEEKNKELKIKEEELKKAYGQLRKEEEGGRRLLKDNENKRKQLELKNLSLTSHLKTFQEHKEIFKEAIFSQRESIHFLKNEYEKSKLLIEESENRVSLIQEELSQKNISIQSIQASIAHTSELLENERWTRIMKEQEVRSISNSFSYKIGRAITFPIRFLFPIGSKREAVLILTKKILLEPKLFWRQLGIKRIKNFLKAVSGDSSDMLKMKVEEAHNFKEQNEGAQIQKTVEAKTIPTHTSSPITFTPCSSPKASIVIPVFNNWETTYNCLKSIKEHTNFSDYEIIVADDSSTDETGNLRKIIKNIKVVRGEKNLGFTKNCNRAALETRGGYIVFLNNDTLVQPGWLGSLVETAEKDSKIGIVGAKLIYPNGKLQEAGGIIWRDGKGWNYGRGEDHLKPEYNYTKEVDYVSGACLLISKKLWQEIGGFDERYAPAYYEDTDLAFEARKRDYKVVYQPQSMVIHIEGASCGTDEKSGLKKYQVINHKKFLKKWKEVLEKDHFDSEKEIFRARDRSRDKKTILVVDHHVPQFDKDAGARHTFQYLELFSSMGFNVKFIGDNFHAHQPYTQKLQDLGIEVLYGQDYSDNWQKWIKQNGSQIDIAYLQRPEVANKYIDFIKNNTKAKIIYFGHDLHYLREQRRFEVEREHRSLRQSERFKILENKIFQKADHILTLSNLERELIRKDHPFKTIDVIPISVFHHFSKPITDFKKRAGLLFVGGFSHPPNENGMLWFLEKIFPKINKQFPKLLLNIVGSHPTEKLLRHKSGSINITGYVTDEELDRYYQKSKIVIIPLLYGAGVKGKLIEAMHHGIPVVSTSIGIEGLPQAEEIIQPCDNEENFAQRIIDLMNDTNGLENMSKREIEYIRKYSSQASAKKLIKEIF
ncbi:MAG: glycosyltransferase [bacterium]|nr:glycosyltransferase [bacterium]